MHRSSDTIATIAAALAKAQVELTKQRSRSLPPSDPPLLRSSQTFQPTLENRQRNLGLQRLHGTAVSRFAIFMT